MSVAILACCGPLICVGALVYQRDFKPLRFVWEDGEYRQVKDPPKPHPVNPNYFNPKKKKGKSR